MGIVLSSGIRTPPLTLTSTIIGFVSFAFTVGTFLKVIWVNLQTASEAPHEVHEYLNTLRQELLEEKTSLRILRKTSRRRQRGRDDRSRGSENGLGSYRGLGLDESNLKTMHDAVKRLIRQFRDIERPFLEEGEDGIMAEKRHHRRRNSSAGSPYYEHSAYAFPDKASRRTSRVRGRSADRPTERTQRYDDEEEMYWSQRVRYANLTVWRRLKWISVKPKAQDLFTTLAKVQTRRIAQQVGGIALLIHEHGASTMEMEDRVRRMDERISRVIGVRRMD